MVWWVVAGLVLVGVALPVGAAMSLREHLRPLRRAQRRLRLRAQQAERLQAKIATMQERMLGLQAALAEATARTQEAPDPPERSSPADPTGSRKIRPSGRKSRARRESGLAEGAKPRRRE